MKHILTWIVEIKNVAAMAFTGMVMIYVVFSRIWGVTALNFGYIWQMLFISLIFAALQYVFLAGELAGKLRYPLRVLLFVAALYIVLSGFALVFHWFTPNVAAWGIFTLIFLAFFGILTAVFEIYFRVTGIRYNRRLEEFKARQNG